jgi:Concanavalin A-like lectin/glucanases superfamily
MKSNTIRIFSGILALALVGASCQKKEQPALGNYPKDQNPPGGPLKFYAAFNGTNADKSKAAVDSIRANFGNVTNGTFVAGINGNAYKGSPTSYIVYPSANDFSKATSFTVSFWMKKDGVQPAGAGTQWVFGLPTTTDIWHRHEMFFEFEDAGNPSTASAAAAKFLLQDQWFEFTGAKRLPNVLNGQWHHMAFVYDQNTSKLSTYLDGVQQYPNDATVTDVKNGSAPRGPLSFKNVSGFVIGGPGHYAIGKTPDDWMHPFDGQIDQFRLYGKAMTAAEIQQLFVNKL